MTQSFSDSIVCPNCNAANPADAEVCRRCDTRLPPRIKLSDFERRRAALERMPRDRSHGLQYSLSSLLIGLTVAAIVLGVFVRAPGIGIAIAVCCLPAFIRTALLIRKRQRLGRSTSTGTKILALVGSVLFAGIAAVVVLVASVGTFCTICFMGAGSMKGGDKIIVFSATAAIVVTLLLLIVLGKYSKYRWDRDIDRED